jgi:hypothetical protein
MKTTTRIPQHLVIRSEVCELNGRTVTALLIRSTSRPSGRRIVIAEGETVLFDTDEQHDVGNACSVADAWWQSQVHPQSNG